MIDMIVVIAKLVFWLGMAILVHELGHFLAAKLFGIRVIKFSIGFPPRLFGFRRGETEYVLSAIPVGGYVKLSGEDWDEKATDSHDLMAKPWWVRIIVYASGVVMNVALAFLLFYVHLVRGVEIGNYPAVLGAVHHGSSGESAGLKAGDRIIEADGKPVSGWNEFAEIVGKAGPGAKVALRLERGKRIVSRELSFTRNSGLEPFVEPVVGFVMPAQPARKAGMAAGDRIISIQGKRITQWNEVSRAIGAAKPGPIKMKVDRAGKSVVITVTPKKDPLADRAVIGISPAAPSYDRKRFSPVKSAIYSAEEIWIITGEVVKVVWKVVTFKVKFAEAMGGPVLIAQLGYEKAREGIWELLHYIGVLNVQLVIANLLPIPMLDGGMILLALWEGARRRRLSMKTYQNLTTVGFAFLIALILLATYHDFRR